MTDTTLTRLLTASDECLALADLLHQKALEVYPAAEFMQLDSQSLLARTLHLQLITAFEVRRFESGVYTQTQEFDRLTARVSELESYYIKAADADAADLQETVEAINSERLRYKKSIHSELNAEFQLNITAEHSAVLRDLGISV